MSPEIHREIPLPSACADRRLPGLARVLDPRATAARLRPLVGDHGALEVRILKHVDGKRAVLAAEFADGLRLVLKLHRKDRARHHAAVLRELETALRGATRTPRCLDCWEDWGAVVQEWAPGNAAPGYEDLAGREDVVARLAAALAGLHEARVPAAPAAGLGAHLRRLCHPGTAALAADRPDLAPALAELERRIHARGAEHLADPRPCHGDFGPRQALVDGPRVWLVDLDGLCLADPALDVANFRVGLETHLGSAGRALAGCFLDAYRAGRGGAALPALATYEALSDLRRAMILWRKRPPGWDLELRDTVLRGLSRL